MSEQTALALMDVESIRIRENGHLLRHAHAANAPSCDCRRCDLAREIVMLVEKVHMHSEEFVNERALRMQLIDSVRAVIERQPQP